MLDLQEHPPAIWPKNREIQFHLQLRPWLFLPFSFDANACYSEATSLLEEFVDHRAYDQRGAGKWKSLALRSIDGKKEYTEGAENYPAGEFKPTDIWNRCPKTAEFLQKITDVNQCERIRFMLLEPGAEISVHNDAPHKLFSPAINIALNMPEGCEFWVDLNDDGTRNSFSSKIPIQDGSIFLFNSANYHCVKNQSGSPRMHIIIHGPIRLTEAALLQIARDQNKIEGAHSVYTSLINKRVQMRGRELTDEELADLFHLGVRPDAFPDFVSLGILREPMEDPLLELEAQQLTEGSLHPLPTENVPASFLEDWLKLKLHQKKEFAVVVASGNFINSSHGFWLEIMKLMAGMLHEETPLVCHLMNKDGHLPFLHPQFFLLHLPSWRQAGFPGFSAQKKELAFPGYLAAEENIHSNYTPLWLKKKEPGESASGYGGFGTEVLAEFLMRDLKIRNVPLSIRNLKSFGYPENGRGEHWNSLWEKVQDFTKKSESRVYPFNTERLLVRDYRIKPDHILFPCAGLKPLALFRQLSTGRSSVKVSFIEMNPLAVSFYKNLLGCKNFSQVMALLVEEVKKESGTFVGCEAYTEKMLNLALMEGFDHSESEFLRVIQEVASRARFYEWNYFHDQDRIISLIGEDTFFFWHSNAWQTNAALCNYGALSLRKNYRALVAKAKAKFQCKAYTHRNIFETVFGDDFYSPKGVFTMGGKKKDAPKLGAFEPFEDVGIKLLSG